MSDSALNPTETAAYNKGYAEGYRRALLAVNSSVGELMVQSAISPPAPAQLPNRTQAADNRTPAPATPRVTKPFNSQASALPDPEDSDLDMPLPFVGPAAAPASPMTPRLSDSDIPLPFAEPRLAPAAPKTPRVVKSIPQDSSPKRPHIDGGTPESSGALDPSPKRPRVDGGTPESSGALDQPHDCAELSTADKTYIKEMALRRTGLKIATLKRAYFKGEVALAGHVAVTIYRPGGPCARCKAKDLACIVPDPSAGSKNFFKGVACAECQGWGAACKEA
jgi:hypothetical protein